MKFNKKVNWHIHTNGKGLWSKQAKLVRVIDVWVSYVNDEGTFGELCAEFDTKDWNPDVDGLIYTDDQWIGEFRALMKTLGFSPMAVEDISYSEQGMQGDSYVSMDIGKKFIEELEPMYRFVINKQAINIHLS
jgi:hypothetical protein